MEEKVCSRCKVKKTVDNFARRSGRRDKYQPYCRECQKEYDRQRYLKNKDYIDAQNKAGRERRRNESQCNVIKYLKEHPCIDCKEDDPIVLTFDHVEGNKCFNIADALKDGMKWERIEEEIKKCKVRCANCHMRKTAYEQGWFKTKKI
jgi:hypothetical protein